jgi:serine/threonine-protein kinase
VSDKEKPVSTSPGTYSLRPGALSLKKRVEPLEKLPPGELLEGKYQIREPIGEGGMGVVYEAEHVALGLVVAVKVLHPTEPNAPHVIERFKTEARSAANIRHPNVVEVTDFGLTPDQRPFFVMEHLNGESLSQRLESNPRLPERVAVDITDQILSGLSSAHKRGVIHRDLKPENVYLAKTEGLGETVKLLDFGVARIIGGEELQAVHPDDGPARASADGKPLTQRGIVLGTPGYLAPETARGAPADLRSDLFSVGVILYEMLIGRRPFRGDSIEQIISSTLDAVVPSPRALRPDLTPEMERLVLTSLAKNPADRFQTAGEFLRHLAAAAVGRIPENARPCVTETSQPSVAPPPIDTLPLVPGNQEDIETLDSMRATSSSDDGPVKASTPSPSPAVPWSTEEARELRVAQTPGRGRIILIVGGIAAAMVIGLAIVAAILLSGDDQDLDGSDDPTTPRAGTVRDQEHAGAGQRTSGETTTIWIDVAPLAATITWDGRVINDRPLVVPRGGRDIEMLVSHPGYVPERLMIRPDKERSVRVNLHRIP